LELQQLGIIGLITTLPEFKLKYPTDHISKTIPKVRRRIKGKLDDLVNLELLQSEKKKQDRVTGQPTALDSQYLGNCLDGLLIVLILTIAA
jgi:hypothetical protein